MNRYYACSASDRTVDWPYWFVADRNRGGLNVTAELIRAFRDPEHGGTVLTTCCEAEKLALVANQHEKHV